MLKKTLAALALGSALFTAGQAMAADYKIDKEGQHAFIEFRIKHLGYSWLYGRFNDFDGSFTFDEKNPSADKVKVTINTNSVDTNHAERDKHLRSGDFLNLKRKHAAVCLAQRNHARTRRNSCPHARQRIFRIRLVPIVEMLGIQYDFSALRHQECNGIGNHAQIFFERGLQYARDLQVPRFCNNGNNGRPTCH